MSPRDLRTPVKTYSIKRRTLLQTKLLSNKDYDLISVIYHSSHGAVLCDQFITDAEKEGDQEAVQLFRETQEHYLKLAQKGRVLLKNRL